MNSYLFRDESLFLIHQSVIKKYLRVYYTIDRLVCLWYHKTKKDLHGTNSRLKNETTRQQQ